MRKREKEREKGSEGNEEDEDNVQRSSWMKIHREKSERDRDEEIGREERKR